MASHTILVVENGRVDRRAMELIAGRIGHVVSVSLLSEAAERLRAFRPDCIVLDLGLDDSDGIDTFRRMKQVALGVPIIVATSDCDDPTTREILLDHGRVVHKMSGDFPAELEAAIRDLISGVPRVSPEIEAIIREVRAMRAEFSEKIGKLGSAVEDIKSEQTRQSRAMFGYPDADGTHVPGCFETCKRWRSWEGSGRKKLLSIAGAAVVATLAAVGSWIAATWSSVTAHVQGR